jgi:hypothetical protein
MGRGSSKYATTIPKTWVDEETDSVIQYFMDKYSMSKSNAIRHLLTNGVVYTAMEGDGIAEDK